MLIDKNGNFVLKNIISYPDEDYESLKDEALECKRCHLNQNCTQVVMGEGAIEKNIMFVGEGPGATEDRQGRPFVGRAGQLLDRILSAINVDRKNIYISNIVKCRPPDNRQPTKEEARACSPILKAEFDLINPKVIVPMGATALKYLIDEDASITETRGQWIKRGDRFFLPTYHPAYLLRNKNMKKYVWRDFQVIKKAIERIQELKVEEKLN